MIGKYLQNTILSILSIRDPEDYHAGTLQNGPVFALKPFLIGATPLRIRIFELPPILGKAPQARRIISRTDERSSESAGN
jgi:hypothetical protein